MARTGRPKANKPFDHKVTVKFKEEEYLSLIHIQMCIRDRSCGGRSAGWRLSDNGRGWISPPDRYRPGGGRENL